MQDSGCARHGTPVPPHQPTQSICRSTNTAMIAAIGFRSTSRALLVRQQCSLLSFRTLQRSVPFCLWNDDDSATPRMTNNFRHHPQRRLFSTPTETTSQAAQTSAASSEASTDETKPASMIVYESPLGNVVGKLRSVSLLTAIVGAVGVPTMIALKGGIAAPTGILAVALTFVTGTMGSTAAIHFIFGPYIYQLERIPVRVCSSPSTSTSPAQQETEPEREPSCNAATSTNGDDTTKPTMLKATTKTLFLQRREIVFDPITDVTPYKGLRPMCNFEAKGIPLYVHPEFVYDDSLIKALQLKTADDAQPMPSKENPDDFL